MTAQPQHLAGARAYRRKILGRTNAQEPSGLAICEPPTDEHPEGWPLGYAASPRAIKRVTGGRTR